VTPPELPPDILARIDTDYDLADRPTIVEALLTLPDATREPERVARCVLFVANGSLDEFERMVQLARIDFRDAIVAAEYDRDLRRLRDFGWPFGEAEFGP
jgi:hypothetical protein